MSRTHHHRHQKTAHSGHEYGAKYQCNRLYGQSYGTDGRDRADKERRQQGKKIIRGELND